VIRTGGRGAKNREQEGERFKSKFGGRGKQWMGNKKGGKYTVRREGVEIKGGEGPC